MTRPSALERILSRRSFIELRARERAAALLDPGTLRELVGPFDRVHSPWLPLQGIVPQEDDGAVVARGTLDGRPAVVAAIESAFQGGSLGEVAGTKIACALELALRDCERGRLTAAVLLLETGGVRLQEANLGLAVIAEIHAQLVALRRHAPVIGVVAGLVGCFGGMGLASALCSHLVVTRQARVGMNGPEVIEQEAGVEELDAADRPLVWSVYGGEHRYAAGLADALVEDDAEAVRAAVVAALRAGAPREHRSERVAFFQERLARVAVGSPPAGPPAPAASRGLAWLTALTSRDGLDPRGPASVRVVDAPIEGEMARFLAVVPDPGGRFPRARRGEVGLEEGWALAARVREAVALDTGGTPRPIVALVDVPGQAFGRTEESQAIHLSCAAAVDAYATARLAGHPVIALLVGPAISGAFLAHGYQANRILALDDAGVLVHAMGKQAAARVTRRSVAEVEELGARILPMSHDVRRYARLGTLDALLPVASAETPTADDVATVRRALARAVEGARQGPRDLGVRLTSDAARETRAASLEVRRRMYQQWSP